MALNDHNRYPYQHGAEDSQIGKKSGGSDSSKAAAQDRNTARDTTYADRPDQFNPFGNVTWQTESVVDPASGNKATKWIQNQGMSEDVQRLYDNQMTNMQARGDLSAGMMGRIENEMGGAPDWAQFGDVNQMEYDPTTLRQRAEDAAYQKETMRLDPRFQKEAEALEIKLRNQGLRPGDQAYDATMESYSNSKNDAYEQARLGAVQTGQSEADMLWSQQMAGTEMANALRDKQIQEYLSKRQFSLGESNALNPLNDMSALAGIVTGEGTKSNSGS